MYSLNAIEWLRVFIDDAVHSVSPPMPEVIRGDPDAPKFSFPGAFCDSRKAKAVLQLKEFRGLAECARDTLSSLHAKGL